MKPTITVQETSMRGHSLFVVHEAEDKKYLPAVSTTMPTHISKWLKAVADASNDGPSNYTEFAKTLGPKSTL